MKSSKYSKKEQVEEFIFSVRRAYQFAGPLGNYTYPQELAQFREPLLEIDRQLNAIEERYFRAQWDREDKEAAR